MGYVCCVYLILFMLYFYTTTLLVAILNLAEMNSVTLAFFPGLM